MNKLKIAFLDFWPEIKDENIFLPILQKHFDVEIDVKSPDIVIHSIFGGLTQSARYKCKKILFLGENYRASSFKSDFSISFDPMSETNFRLPLWQFYLILRPELKNFLFKRINYDSFDRFCSFTVSNPNNWFRNGFYSQLNSYKKVHSYGRFMTNDFSLQRYLLKDYIEFVEKQKIKYKLVQNYNLHTPEEYEQFTYQKEYWRNLKYLFFIENRHKFALTFEHSAYPGYETEKLMDGFLGGSIPIYWGSKLIEEDFNENAFINVMKEKDPIKLIKEIDNNDNLFNQYYNEPVFTDIQKEKHLKNIEQFETWLVNVIKK